MDKYEIFSQAQNATKDVTKTIELLTYEVLKYKALISWLDDKQNHKQKTIDIQEIILFLWRIEKEDLNTEDILKL